MASMTHLEALDLLDLLKRFRVSIDSELQRDLVLWIQRLGEIIK